MITYTLSEYANISQLITDPSYASEKGISVKTYKIGDIEHFMLNYKKKSLKSDNMRTLGLFRSVVVNKEGKILSYSPQKSFEEWTTPSVKVADVWATEFCAGTMINLFYSEDAQTWELNTRGNIGARCKFFIDHPNTFRYLFLQILNHYNIEFDHFDKKYSYSFIMQHPENRIVVPFDKMDLKIVQISEQGMDSINVMHDIEEIQNHMNNQNLPFKPPRSLNKVIDCEGKTIYEIKEMLETLNFDYKLVGAVFYDPNTQSRCKFRNPSYDMVKSLRGNNPKIQFQYYHLRQHGKVKQFLEYFPEKKGQFEVLRNQMHEWTNTLYSNYVNCYIKKQAPLKEWPYEFRTHMYNIHQKYLNDLKPNKMYVSRGVVIEYVNTLPPPKLMYSINYKMRHRAKTEEKKEIEESITSE